MKIGHQSDVGAIKRLVLKHVRDAFVADELIDRQWRELNYTERPDLAASIEEYDRFVTLLEGFGASIDFLPPAERVGMDSLYPRDTAIVCDKGLILCNMGKPGRVAEPAAIGEAARALELPICGAVSGEGTIEGGDVVWVDERTLAVGRGYRTNAEGIRQVRELLGDCVDELIEVPLPHWHGPDDVFHLMSMVSPIDRDLMLVYSRLLPVPFRESLISRGIELVEVPDEEFESMGCNVLAVAPRKCVMISGNPVTRARLEGVGAEVHEIGAKEICAKGSGGPTCLTRPILRELAG